MFEKWVDAENLMNGGEYGNDERLVILSLAKGRRREEALALLIECVEKRGVRSVFEDKLGQAVAYAAVLWDRDALLARMYAWIEENKLDLADEARMLFLRSAASNGRIDLLESFMKPGDGKRFVGMNGETLLMVAAGSPSKHALDVLNFLLPLSDVSARNRGGMSILEHAAQYGSLESMKWCLEKDIAPCENGVSSLEALCRVVGTSSSERDVAGLALLLERANFETEGEWFEAMGRKKWGADKLYSLDKASRRVSDGVARDLAAKARIHGLDVPMAYARMEALEIAEGVVAGKQKKQRPL